MPYSWVVVTSQSSFRGTISTSCSEELDSSGRWGLSHPSAFSPFPSSRLKTSFSFCGCTELRMITPSPSSRHSSPETHRVKTNVGPCASSQHVPSHPDPDLGMETQTQTQTQTWRWRPASSGRSREGLFPFSPSYCTSISRHCCQFGLSSTRN